MRAGLLTAVFFLLFLLPGSAGAQEDGLTLGQAARRAMERHPSVAASRSVRASAQARAEEAEAAWLPTVSASATGTRFEEPMVVSPIHGFTPNTAPPFDRTLLQAAGHLTYTLYDGGRRGGRIEGARQGARAADAGLRGSGQDLLLRVVTVYLDALGSARVLEAHDRRLDALEAERERVLDYLEVGRAAEVERLRVEAAVVAARARRVELETRLELAERALARLAELPVQRTRASALMPVAEPPPTVPEGDSVFAAAAEANPEIQELRRRVQGARASLSVARSARWPRVELRASHVSQGSDDHDFVNEWNAGLRVSVPLFTGGATGSRIEAASAEHDAARERLRAAELQVRGLVDEAVAVVREARARRRSLEAAVERTEAVVRVEELRLETGTGVQSEFLDAQAALLDARAGLARARFGELTARARLARARGRLTVEWIDSTLGEDR